MNGGETGWKEIYGVPVKTGGWRKWLKLPSKKQRSYNVNFLIMKQKSYIQQKVCGEERIQGCNELHSYFQDGGQKKFSETQTSRNREYRCVIYY